MPKFNEAYKTLMNSDKERYKEFRRLMKNQMADVTFHSKKKNNSFDYAEKMMIAQFFNVPVDELFPEMSSAK